MASFNELLQKYVNADYEVLVSLAKGSAAKILPICKKIDDEHDGMLLLSAILLSAVAADGTFSDKEKQFISDVFGLSGDTVSALVKIYTGKEYDLVDKFADSLNSELKVEVINLVATVAACDETITRSESAFISNLID